MTDIVLDPLLLESLDAGPDACVAQWLVAEGDDMHAGQVPAPRSGILEQIQVAVGEKFDRGAVLARPVAT